MWIFLTVNTRKGKVFLRYSQIRPWNKRGGEPQAGGHRTRRTRLETKASVQPWWFALKIAVSFERFEDIGKCSFVTDLTRQITRALQVHLKHIAPRMMELGNFCTSYSASSYFAECCMCGREVLELHLGLISCTDIYSVLLLQVLIEETFIHLLEFHLIIFLFRY